MCDGSERDGTELLSMIFSHKIKPLSEGQQEWECLEEASRQKGFA